MNREQEKGQAGEGKAGEERPREDEGRGAGGLDAYFRLVDERPGLFKPDGELRVVTDRAEVEAFARESKRAMGVVYGSAYNVMVVDLVEDRKGRRFAYERVVPARSGAPVVVVPVSEDGLVLLRHFRHATRSYQLEFPRGFGEDGLSARQNAMKELLEELGARAGDMVLLGSVCPDTGLTSTEADVFLCRVGDVRPSATEGIVGTRTIPGADLRTAVARGEVEDGFTLSALALLGARRDDPEVKAVLSGAGPVPAPAPAAARP